MPDPEDVEEMFEFMHLEAEMDEERDGRTAKRPGGGSPDPWAEVLGED